MSKRSTTTVALIPLSRLGVGVSEPIDSVAVRQSKIWGGDVRYAYEVLLEAQRYWQAMHSFRAKRARYKRYNYGDQWQDIIKVDGKWQTEEEYIMSQGNVALKNNLIRRLVNQVIGVYRSQSKEPTCIARDREEQQLGDTMSTVLQCNMQLNRMNDILARSLEEFLISGLVVHSKRFGWRNDKLDCWTDYVSPNNIFIDNKMRDFRAWDLSCIGEIHDISFGDLVGRFAHSTEDYSRLSKMYHQASNRDYIRAHMSHHFGEDMRSSQIDFFVPQDPTTCRVIEVWRKEEKARYRCHDPLNGDVYKIDTEDYSALIEQENVSRTEQGIDAGIPEEEIPLIRAEWFVDSYWYYYYLTPTGEILEEGETPYEHKSHPYVLKAYPFIDGEIHSFVGNVIDQQRYTNRLITLYDWIMRASAKGVLLFPEEALPDNMSLEDVADEWSRFNGVIAIKTKNGAAMPHQISNNSTNIGIGELLHLQLKLFEDISGIHGALQGKPGTSNMSASLYAQQAQNSSTSLLDILDTFSSFVQDGAYKDVKNIQQYYDEKRVFNIAGRKASRLVYDPEKIRDVEFDLSITEATSTPAYRQIANDFLMQLFQMQQINVEQLLQHGDFPFADELLQSIQSQQQLMSNQGGMATAQSLPPGAMAELEAQSDPRAMEMLSQYTMG